MLLEVPKNTKVLDLPSSTMWIDEDGILYSVGKGPARERTLEELMEDMAKVRSFIGERNKVCVVIESNSRNSAPPR